MPRYDEATNSQFPEGGPQDTNPGDMKGFRHWGDGIAGQAVEARIRGYYPGGTAYVDVQVDANGVVQTAGGGGGAGTQYTEDAVSAADPVGTAVALRRRDALVSEVSADGDVVAANGTGKGELYVKHADAIPVTDNGGLLSVDDGAGSLTVDNPALAVTGGGVEATALRVTLASDSTGVVSVDDNGGSLTVDGTVTADTELTTQDYDTGAGTVAAATVGVVVPAAGGPAAITGDAANGLDVDVTRLPSLPAGTNNIGDVDVLTLPGTFAEDVPHTSGDVGHFVLGVRNSALTTLTSADGDYSPVAVDNAGRLILNAPLDITGLQAHDAAISGNDPVLIAARANANEPTAVSADGDVTHLWADLLGRLVVTVGHPNPEPPVNVNATASGNTTVIAAPGASLSLHICKASIINRDATNRLVALQDGAGGTVRWRGELASEGGGANIDFGSRGWKLTANTLLNVNLDAAGNVDVNIHEFYIAA